MITKDIQKAIEALENNELIALPTETVYGLAGNAYNETAIKKNFELKKRPLYNPLIVHLHSVAQLKEVAREIPEKAKILAEKYLGDKYDVEIAMTYNDFEYVLNSSNRKSKKIGWFHSEINLPKLKPLIPKILSEFPLFNHMIYCSQKIKDMMHEEYPELDFPKESVIINAIPIEEIKQKAAEIIYDFPDAEKVFISVGRLHTRKGFHKLIKAHSRLIKDGYSHTIIIIGDGEEKMNLQKMIRDYSVEETFFLLGNKMNPYPYLKKADYFILPSESEAWPLVIAESLILQKPIIATNTGDVSQMIYHEKTGYLINYNTEEMYNSMKKIYDGTTICGKNKRKPCRH